MTSSRDGVVLRGAAAEIAAPFSGASFPAAAPEPHPAHLRLDEVYAEEMTRLREQARQDGYAAGHAEGLLAAAAAVEAAVAEARAEVADEQQVWVEQMRGALAALGAAADRLEATRAPAAAEITDMLTRGLFTLVQDLLGRELAASTDPGMDAVRRALTLLPADAPATIRLHPEDHARLSPDVLAALPAHLTILADPTVERGGAIAESGARRVDAQIGAALRRAREVLAP